MSDIPRDPIGATDSYHANITINAPVDTVFAAVSSVAGLSGWWGTVALCLLAACRSISWCAGPLRW